MLNLSPSILASSLTLSYSKLLLIAHLTPFFSFTWEVRYKTCITKGYVKANRKISVCSQGLWFCFSYLTVLQNDSLQWPRFLVALPLNFSPFVVDCLFLFVWKKQKTMVAVGRRNIAPPSTDWQYFSEQQKSSIWFF